MLTISYHRGQRRIFGNARKRGARFITIQAGRRFGKSRGGRTNAIEKTFRDWRGYYDPDSPPCTMIVMPEQKRAKQLHWPSLLAMFERSPLVAGINKTDLRIVFNQIEYPDGVVRQPPDILLAGAQDGGEKVRGNRLWGILVDEYQDFPPAMWRQIIRPALSDTPNSWAILIGTPKGKATPLAKIRRDYAAHEGWQHYHALTKHNPFIPRAEIRAAKAELPPRDFRQEYEASEEDFPGRIYSEFDPTKHIVDSAPDDCQLAFLGFDAGDVNPAVVVHKAKQIGGKWCFWAVAAEQMGNGSDAVSDAAQDARIAELCKKFDVDRVFSPPERGTRILAFREHGKAVGIKGMQRTIAAKNSVSPGNSFINSLYYQNRLFVVRGCWVQPHDISFPDEINSYHRQQDPKTEMFIDEPAKNQVDHRLDAQRYDLFTLHTRSLALR